MVTADESYTALPVVLSMMATPTPLFRLSAYFATASTCGSCSVCEVSYTSSMREAVLSASDFMFSCVYVWKCCCHTNDSTPMATMAVMAAIRANAMVMRVAYVRLFHQLRTPWNGFFLRFFPSEGRSTTTGPVDAEPVV